MKDKRSTTVAALNLSKTYKAPEYIESKGKKIVEWGRDNLHPDFLLDIYNNKSSTHKSIINRKAQMIAGQGFDLENATEEVISFINNSFGVEDLNKILYKCAYDMEIFSAFALELVWSNDSTKVLSIKHIPLSYIRIGLPDKDINYDFYKVSSDWSQSRKEEYKPEIIRAFDPNYRKGKQILLTKQYNAEQNYYPVPRYSSSINWILLDNQISTFHLASVTNGFMPSYAVNFMSGQPEDDEKAQVKKEFTKTYTGANEAGQPVLLWSDNKDESVNFTKLELNDSDERFILLSKQLTEEILKGHEVVNPLLFGVKVAGELGGKQELEESLAIFQAVYVKPLQNVISEVFNELFNINNQTSGEIKLNTYSL